MKVKKYTSQPGLMGMVQYYDNQGRLAGESEPTLLGGTTYYEVK